MTELTCSTLLETRFKDQTSPTCSIYLRICCATNLLHTQEYVLLFIAIKREWINKFSACTVFIIYGCNRAS